MISDPSRPSPLVLDPRIKILTRPDGRIQLGWDPEHALVLTPPINVGAAGLISVLRLLDGKNSRPHILWCAVAHGIEPAAMSTILAELDRAGILGSDTRHPVGARAIRIHGRGPLSDAIATALAGTGTRISRSFQYTAETEAVRWNVNCVVLTDDLVTDPRLVADLVRHGIPHLQVRLRDGRGVVGPLVLPGHTSCLRCADLLRCAHDGDWPHLAAQLLGSVGHATPATVMATAAIALGQLEIIMSLPRRSPPASLNATLEIDLASHRVVTRRWPRQADCSCAHLAPPVDGASTFQP